MKFPEMTSLLVKMDHTEHQRPEKNICKDFTKDTIPYNFLLRPKVQRSFATDTKTNNEGKESGSPEIEKEPVHCSESKDASDYPKQNCTKRATAPCECPGKRDVIILVHGGFTAKTWWAGAQTSLILPSSSFGRLCHHT